MQALVCSWKPLLIFHKEIEQCTGWDRLLADDVKAGSQHHQVMTYKSIRDSFGYNGHGQTTVLHVSTLQVRLSTT